MLQATFCPCAVSSIPLITSGAVSNRTWTSADKVSLIAWWIACCCSGGKSKALRTRSGSDDARTWTFTLRKGVTFHNGDALRALPNSCHSKAGG